MIHNKTYTSLLQHMFFNYKNMLKKTDKINLQHTKLEKTVGLCRQLAVFSIKLSSMEVEWEAVAYTDCLLYPFHPCWN